MKKTLITLLATLMLAGLAFGQAVRGYDVGGRYIANAYNSFSMKSTGAVAAGSAVMTLTGNGIADPNASCFVETSGFGSKRFTPLFVGNSLYIADANSEAVTVTAVSTTAGSCSFTASFASAHNAGVRISSATGGLYEAINDAFLHNGSRVILTPDFVATQAQIQAAPAYPSIVIEDDRGASPQYWGLGQTATTVLGTPATLTAVTALPSATPVGAFGTGTYHLCISYVDIMGNEGPCSADFSEAGLTTSSFIFSAPAASAGAVGYTIYISLTSGTYALSYKVPLSSSICNLTPLESITAACAVTNATWGQSGSAATVTAITVNTARLAPQASTISATTDYVPNTNARTTYAYVPFSQPPIVGIVQSSLSFPIGAAANTTVPAVIGTLHVPAGFMNFVGRTIEVCGYANEAANGSTATITTIQAYWDADGSNSAGVPVVIGSLPITNTMVTGKSDQYHFCFDFKTTVAGAGVTAGSIQQNGGVFCNQYTNSGVATVPACVIAQGPAAVASLNLAGEARIDLVYLHTTGQDANGLTLTDLTVKVLN